MTKSEKKQVIIMIGIMVKSIVILLVIKSVKKKDNEEFDTTQIDTYVEKKEDGTKLNTSEELRKTKKLGELEFADIRLTSKDGESYLEAKVKNTGTSKTGDEFIKITIFDKEKKVLNTINIYLGTIEEGEEINLSSKTSSDFVNAYDFEVSR